MHKMKGYSLSDMPVLAIVFVVLAITVGVGAGLMAQVQTLQLNNTGGTTIASNISGQGLTGLTTFGTWLPTIALVLCASVVIGILLYSFAFKKGS